MKKYVLVIVLTVATLISQVNASDGINLIGVGPVQKGTAGAGIASAKDSTWLILNPAGLTDIERGVDVSLELFSPVRSINSTMSGGAGKQEDDSSFIVPSMSGSLGCNCGQNGFLGIGLYGTSGMGVDYDFGRLGADTDGDGMPDTPQNQVDQMTELSIAKMTLVYAQNLKNDLSIGGGPVLVMSRLRTDMLNERMVPQSGSWDDATGIGAILGVTKGLGPVSLGASYTSQQYMEKFDEYRGLMPDSFDLPQQAGAGVAYDVAPNVELVLDYVWINWSGVDELGDHFGWDDQHIGRIGVTWDVSDELTLRTGYSHGNAPIDEDTAFSNSLFPAIMEDHLACGFSYDLGNLGINFAYVHAFEQEVTANGNDMIPATGQPAGRGTEISMYQNTYTLGATYAF